VPDTKPVFENDFYRVKQCRHGLLAYHKNDPIIGKSLDLYGEWCESELVLLKQVNDIRPFDTVLDIGAHVGSHTLFFAKLVDERGGEVLSFEPQRGCFTLLCTNLALNGLQRVAPHKVVVSDETGVMGVPLLRQDVAASFGAIGLLEDVPRTDRVNMITIDSLDLQSCSLIKVDVEGMEAHVIRGAENTIQNHRPVLFVECNKVEGSRNLLSTLEGYNYDCYWHIDVYFSARNYFENDEDVFEELRPEANLLCFPKERGDKCALLPIEGLDDNCVSALERLITQSS